MQIGFIGLGKMGSRMATKLLEDGHNLVMWNRSKEPIEEFKNQSLKLAIPSKNVKVGESIEDLVKSLQKPRVIWSMLPAGVATEAILDEVSKYVEKNDIVVDGGNSYYKDTEKRHQELQKQGVRFLGVGVSGGVIAAKTGYPMMVGGDRSAYDYITQILDSLAKPSGGHAYLGGAGAGHFAKMVHNAIEYGYMQALGEGFGVLQSSSYNFDLTEVAKVYQKRTLISGFMMDRVVDALEKDQNLTHIQGAIGSASKETVWTIEEAKKEGLPIEIIERSLEFRRQSETDSKIQSTFAAKLVAALREVFGGHEIKKKD